jgi:hypothetical protein
VPSQDRRWRLASQDKRRKKRRKRRKRKRKRRGENSIY